jgi:hypothetical protein
MAQSQRHKAAKLTTFRHPKIEVARHKCRKSPLQLQPIPTEKYSKSRSNLNRYVAQSQCAAKLPSALSLRHPKRSKSRHRRKTKMFQRERGQ